MTHSKEIPHINNQQDSKNDGCSKCDNYFLQNKTNFQHFFKRKETRLNIGVESVSQILFLLSGELRICYGTQNEYTLLAGNMALIVSGYEQRISVIEDSEFIIIRTNGTIQICSKISAKSVRDILKKIEYVDPILPIYPQMSRFLDSVKEYIKDETSCVHLYKAKSMELFVVFRFYYSLEQIAQFFYTILEGRSYFQSQVFANYREAKNVPQLAQLCGYGVSNFKQLFKQYFEKTPYKWMLEIRANEISEALKNKDVPIKMIASQFNFTDQSHLNAYCKKYMGATPRQIRER